MIFAMSANHCSPLLPAASGRPCQLPFQHPFCSFSTEPQFQSWWQCVQADPCTGPSSSLSPTVRGPRSTAGLAPHRSQDSLRPLSLKGSEMTAAQGLSPGQHTCSAPHRALSIKHHPYTPCLGPKPKYPKNPGNSGYISATHRVCLLLFTEKKVHNIDTRTYVRRPRAAAALPSRVVGPLGRQGADSHGGLPWREGALL